VYGPTVGNAPDAIGAEGVSRGTVGRGSTSTRGLAER
jgi:hypothetical protein